MRQSTVASIARRLIKSVAATGRSLVDAVLEGAMPAPQPVPVRIRTDRRR